MTVARVESGALVHDGERPALRELMEDVLDASRVAAPLPLHANAESADDVLSATRGPISTRRAQDVLSETRVHNSARLTQDASDSLPASVGLDRIWTRAGVVFDISSHFQRFPQSGCPDLNWRTADLTGSDSSGLERQKSASLHASRAVRADRKRLVRTPRDTSGSVAFGPDLDHEEEDEPPDTDAEER